ncbi:DUF1643 domain-containing protein [Clostridium algidicarnis]|uniref:DUF1643 domain-containing protein n=1 Tax=Clostridium algidicarnis TaxID=37659 RepID=UPI001C0BE50A|nr:DUF1643 domain-containing protein [Clostridium algidicarnis]MBU3209408.1 DUF1643 domain-containing protein [Clostridium algidicarnis]
MYNWIYEIEEKNTIRYVIGTVGENPLFCFGINPSIAEPNLLDPTLKKVEKIALNNGYDSWVMLNVYPKRDTIFENLQDVCNDSIHLKNINIIKKYLDKVEKPTIWLAFGDHVYHRKYLIPCFKDIYKEIKENNITWVTTGINKSGSPKHPLYQKDNSILKYFDMDNYMKSLKS